MRRVLMVAALAATMVTGAAASASAEELSDYLERRRSATFSGEQSVVCSTPEGVESRIFEVEQAGGVQVLTALDGTSTSVVLPDLSGWEPSGKYQMVFEGRERYLNRWVSSYDVMEGDLVRVRLRFDVLTGVLLSTDVFNEDGTAYCSARYLAFIPGGTPSTSDPAVSLSPTVTPTEVLDRRLPPALAGFHRFSLYEGPSETVVAADYSDGIFTFTVFSSPRPIAVPELEDVEPVGLPTGEYRRAFLLGVVVIAWESPDGGYVLAGEIPLDVQEDVLAALPEPGRPSFFVRLFRGLFGR